MDVQFGQMSGKLFGCCKAKKDVFGLGSSEPLNERIETTSGARVTVERTATCSTAVQKLVVILFVVFLLVAFAGGIFLSSVVYSMFRQMQNRVEVLERRLGYLERTQETESYEEDDSMDDDVVSSVVQEGRIETVPHSPVERKKRSSGKKNRPSSRSPNTLASIHMEMVSSPQRRKRNPSAENSNHILWKVSDWVPKQSRESFRVSDSELAEIGVKHRGLYFIYAQIVFRNLGTNNIVSIKSKEREFTRCYDGVDYVGDSSEKLKTCYTGTVAMIQANETIAVHNMYGHEIHNESLSNFFGLIKLAETR